MTESLHAWVDESGSDRTRDPNTYILAAALCSPNSVEHVRAAMRPLRARATPKLHWSDETKAARRQLIVDTVAGCSGLEHLVVVRIGVAGETGARPRKVALKQLLVQLDKLQVGRAVFESRGSADDNRDVEVMRHLRDRQQAISPRLRVDHAPGRSDEGLWVPDAVCGAVSAARIGDRRYLEVLQERIVMVTVDHRGEIVS